MDIYYFDYVATTMVDEKTLQIYKDVSQKYFMNPQSNAKVNKLVNDCKIKIIDLLNLNNDYEVIFTSSATEANNLAILGRFKNSKEKKHFITTKIEHPSVIETFNELIRLGHEVDFITPDEFGIVSKQEVLNKIKKNTALVSIMSVNNELGTIQPVNEIFQQIKALNNNILTMCDYVQAVGKIKIDFENVDLGTFSSHKIYGTKGLGVLIKRKKINMEQIIYGSKTSLVPGTKSVADQVVFVNVFKKAIENYEKNNEIIKKNQQYFLNNLNKSQVKINGKNPIGLISLTLNTTANSQTIVEYLEEKKIYISTKASCSQKLNKPSHVLKAIGLNSEQMDKTIRISFSIKTTKNEIDYLVNNLNFVLEKL